MLDLVVLQYQHYRQAAPKHAGMGRGSRREGEGRVVARKTGRAKVSTAAVLTLVESTARELEHGQTEI